jgi:hypothetical protein
MTLSDGIGIFKAFDAAAHAFDDAVFSPTQIGSRLSKWLDSQHEAVALQDLEYAAEAKARNLPNGSTIMSDASKGLTADAWFTHMARARELSPETWVDEFAGMLESIQVSAASRKLLYAWERLIRGWDDQELWNLDTSMSRRLGAQLLELSERAHSWPDGAFETYEGWTSTLALHGSALLAYGTAAGVDDLLTEWDMLPPGDAKTEAHGRIDAHEELLAAGATEAWAWVAKYHQCLWD